MKNNFLFYKLHHAGLINRLMSFEIGLGLAKCTNKKLVIYNVRGNTPDPLDAPSLNYGTDLGIRETIIDKNIPNFFDFIDYPKDLVHELIDFKNVETFIMDEIVLENNSLQSFYFKVKSGNNEKEFAQNKTELLLEDDINYHMKLYTIDNYSRFFFNRTPELDNVFASIKFKDEYWDFAKKIANFLGEFNAIHIRLTDHQHNFQVLENDLNKTIDKLSDKPIIVLTDDVSNKMFKNKNIIMFDDIIVNNFAKEFMSLSNNSEIAFALVGALTLVYAQKFVGTYISTFTGFIHRERNKLIDETFEFVGFDSMSLGSPYSWNDEKYLGTSSLVREWPESRLLA